MQKGFLTVSLWRELLEAVTRVLADSRSFDCVVMRFTHDALPLDGRL
jgi:hypothetical protein